MTNVLAANDIAEMSLQVELAQSEYQLPRLTRMWTHLERQAGGRVRGMGEKQIEVDKRMLRSRMGQLRRSLEEVRTHRKQYRERRAEVGFLPLPPASCFHCCCAPHSAVSHSLDAEAPIMWWKAHAFRSAQKAVLNWCSVPHQ